ncbi:MAG TPA: hypothetical protein VM943_02455 [Pyrinomonadaceae bacterium]|nr:hypothetical protein [Pyrinomonadaceae bacterium]
MKNLSLLTLLLATVLLVGALTGKFVFNSVNAQQPDDERKATGPLWEYCAISDLTVIATEGKSIGTANICYFQSAGCRNVVVRAVLDGNQLAEAKSSALAQAAVRLGNEGWEMVGESTLLDVYRNDSSTQTSLFFKRRQR